MICSFCGGAAHPATGCQYSPKIISCWRCTINFWKWLEQRTNARNAWVAKRLHNKCNIYFYKEARKWHPEMFG